MRIGILGGTFDPVHLGHIHLAREAQKRLGLDKVFFVPAYLPPHKESKRNEITPARFRIAMLKRALAGFSAFKIHPFEIQKKRKVYTIETLRALCKRYPRDEFFLLTGADNFSILHQWKDLDAILRLCRFVIARRPGFQKSGSSRQEKILWLPIKPLKISSTSIRESLREGKSVSRFLPRGVATLIKKHRLYQKQDSL